MLFRGPRGPPGPSGASRSIDRVEERVVRFRPRAVLSTLGIVIATLGALWFLWTIRGVLVWILIALFLAVALNPAVEWLTGRGVRRRGLAVAIVFGLTLVVVVALSATFVPKVVAEVNDFAEAAPGYVDDLTSGRGKLGELQQRFQIVDKIKAAVDSGGVGGLLGISSKALSVTKSVLSAIVAIVTITFLTLFMLLEGPGWVERGFGLVPDRHRPRARRLGRDIYRTVGGYVIGNIAISLIAGTLTAALLLTLGIPYALALALIVALLDLVPLAGATIAAVIVSSVAFVDSTRNGIIVLIFFLLYQQLENQVIQPVVYRRTVQVSPLVVLVAVLIGAQIAGVVGALVAIPVAGAIQILIRDLAEMRRETEGEPPSTPAVDPALP